MTYASSMPNTTRAMKKKTCTSHEKTMAHRCCLSGLKRAAKSHRTTKKNHEWPTNRTGETGQVNLDHLTGHFRGHFRGHLRGTFRGSFRGSHRRAENREINPRGSCRGRSCGRSRGHTRGSRFAFTCSVRRPTKKQPAQFKNEFSIRKDHLVNSVLCCFPPKPRFRKPGFRAHYIGPPHCNKGINNNRHR